MYCRLCGNDYYDGHGTITRTFTNFEENFLSSTDIEGLYIYSPKEGRTFSTNYFYRDGLNFKLDNALVCTVDTRNPKYDSDRDHFDNIYVGKDENGDIKEIYEAGISESTYANAKAEFEEYCNTYKVSIEPKELLDEVIPELWHKDMIQCLVALFLGEHDYSNYKKVPIIEYGDEVNYPGTEMLDGLDFSSGIDSDGKYVYIE